MISILKNLNAREDVASVCGDVIPGPPPDFRQTMVINIESTPSYASMQPLERLAFCRRIFVEIFKLIEMETQSSFDGSFSVRMFNCESRVRDYCANISCDRLQSATRSVAWNESSQCEQIEQLLIT